jgi:hypothetical protein
LTQTSADRQKTCSRKRTSDHPQTTPVRISHRPDRDKDIEPTNLTPTAAARILARALG